VLSVIRTTIFSKDVYTFELQFLLEKLKCKIPRLMFLQNLDKFLSHILDMLYSMSWLVTTPNIAQSYYINRFIKISL
jgi:hypothetical protein